MMKGLGDNDRYKYFLKFDSYNRKAYQAWNSFKDFEANQLTDSSILLYTIGDIRFLYAAIHRSYDNLMSTTRNLFID